MAEYDLGSAFSDEWDESEPSANDGTEPPDFPGYQRVTDEKVALLPVLLTAVPRKEGAS